MDICLCIFFVVSLFIAGMHFSGSNGIMRLSSRMSEESLYKSNDDRLSDFGDDVFSRSQDDPEGGGSSTHQLDRRKQRNYRLIIDPFLKQGPTKVYRFDGHIPGVSLVSALL